MPARRGGPGRYCWQRLAAGELVGGDRVAASMIRDLVHADDLDPRGVRIHNARIDGQLDLYDVSANRPFSWAFATLFIAGIHRPGTQNDLTGAGRSCSWLV